MVLLQLKADVVNSNFISVSYIGHLEKQSKDSVSIRDACIIYEFAATDENKNTVLRYQFNTNSQTSVGVIEISQDSILFMRDVKADEEIVFNYEQSRESFAKQREEIQKRIAEKKQAASI